MTFDELMNGIQETKEQKPVGNLLSAGIHEVVLYDIKVSEWNNQGIIDFVFTTPDPVKGCTYTETGNRQRAENNFWATEENLKDDKIRKNFTRFISYFFSENILEKSRDNDGNVTYYSVIDFNEVLKAKGAEFEREGKPTDILYVYREAFLELAKDVPFYAIVNRWYQKGEYAKASLSTIGSIARSKERLSELEAYVEKVGISTFEATKPTQAGISNEAADDELPE